jgi:hypothetical protein
MKISSDLIYFFLANSSAAAAARIKTATKATQSPRFAIFVSSVLTFSMTATMTASITASIFVFTILAPSLAKAKRFSNAYVSFDLPEKWDCTLEQTEWVCRPSSPDLAQQAIILLTAKETGPQDSLGAYQSYLQLPRMIVSRSGQPIQSEVKKVEVRNIANHPWVDGMHLASEVPHYFTRYLATTKDKIAIVVTFSAHKLHYSKFSTDFFRAAESLRVVASNSLLKGPNPSAGMGAGDTFGVNTGGAFMGGDSELPAEPGAEDGMSMSGETRTLMGIAFIVGAIGVYLFIKRRQSSRPRR